MTDADPRAKYRILPPTVAPDDTVEETDAGLSEVEQGGRPDDNSGADPYLRIVGWKPSR